MLKHYGDIIYNVALQGCLNKRLTNEKVVTITRQSSTIDIHGVVLQSLKQPWEATSIDECWINDEVWLLTSK